MSKKPGGGRPSNSKPSPSGSRNNSPSLKKNWTPTATDPSKVLGNLKTQSVIIADPLLGELLPRK